MSPADTDYTGADSLAAITRLFEKQRATALTLRTSSVRERIEKLKRLEQAMFDYQEAIYRACYADFRKPEAEVDITEMLPVVQEARDAIRHLRKWMRPVRVRPNLLMLGTRAAIHHEPLGVCLIISPWNYPFNLTFGPLVSAIAAGNTAILKPSEMTPHCAALMQEIIADLFDEGEVAVVQGAVETTQQLLAQPFDHIFFTGSPPVGKIVMAAAAKTLASVTLELGGKSPVIIDKTVDVRKTAKTLAWTKFSNNGQTCIAPDYVFVHSDIRAEFADAMRDALEQLYGPPENRVDNPDYCRMVNGKHYQHVTGLLDDATRRGARIIAGGEHDAAANYIAPTVIDNVADDASIMEEEIFGPVLLLLPYSDLDYVISNINAKPKPLALYVFSGNADTIRRVISRTSAGGTCINTAMVQFIHGHLPFGGVNNSGMGNAHGYWGFKTFSHQRAVLRDRFAPFSLFMPPFNAFTRRFIRFVVRFLA